MKKIEVGGAVLFQELQDEVVLLNTENQRYYGLDDVGAAIWKSLLENDGNIVDTAKRLRETWDAEESVIRADIEILVRRLGDEGLIKIF